MKLSRLRGPVVVAIPVRNEAARIAACVRALARQDRAVASKIVLLLNNCTDATAAIVQDLAPTLAVPVEMIACKLERERANAGHARHLALELATAGMNDGVVLTTDADGIVAPDWIATNLAALQNGADAVAGRAIIDPVEARQIPQCLHDDDARECQFSDLLDEITALVDPEPWDPWPRHAEHSGASIAVTLRAYRAAGGIPAIPLGEDRAFFDSLRRIDARIRHAPEVRVTVSGRTLGRAAGGMADTIRRRMAVQDAWLDDRLEPATCAAQRAELRAATRHAWAEGRVMRRELATLAGKLRLPVEELAATLTCVHFGESWMRIEATSPVLARHRVPVARVNDAIREARSIRDALRAQAKPRQIAISAAVPADRDGIAAPEAAAMA